MPGFDGTGPRGLGPMTGGGRGFCVFPRRAVGGGAMYRPVRPRLGLAFRRGWGRRGPW
ncbi:MAG: DUF5320 domain-containing protein [bacterium]|nr:DUF5320 domain-containing protein [Bacillota bacterium]